MINQEIINYIPILKTTDAELLSLDNLDDSVKDDLLPLFELTRSRKSKTNPDQLVDRRLDRLQDVLGGRPFILDVTAHQDLQTPQIEGFFDEIDGFKNWCNFVIDSKRTHSLNFIPVIHMLPPDYGANSDVIQQIEVLGSEFENLAFRYSIDDLVDDDIDDPVEAYKQELDAFLSLIKSVFPLNRLILIVDALYIDTRNLACRVELYSGLFAVIEKYEDCKIISLASSSFPKFVATHGSECKDSEGVIKLLENEFFRSVCASTSKRVVYGDYATVHPIRQQMAGGSWVPRIDYPLVTEVIYKRYRRPVGGYVTCAGHLVLEPKYFKNRIDCWGEDQIVLAASKVPKGRSPSFWISVRINIYISRMVLQNAAPRCLRK